MKKIYLILISLFLLSSCGSINFKRDGGAKTVKMPFAEEDYQDNNTYFYSIQSTRGTGSRSAIKNATLNLSARYQSDSYMNFENSESLADYFLLNARIDYKYGNYFTSLYLNNVTDIHYFNNGEVNSEGQRSYWVQPPRNFFISVGCNF